MKQVRVDFNARGPRGLVKASLTRADGPLALGQKVLAVDPDEADMRFVAFVESIDHATGRVWLEVDWMASPPVVLDMEVSGPVVSRTRNAPSVDVVLAPA
jgi:hypothetical protein